MAASSPVCKNNSSNSAGLISALHEQDLARRAELVSYKGSCSAAALLLQYQTYMLHVRV